jgi:hypothetical protein
LFFADVIWKAEVHFHGVIPDHCSRSFASKRHFDQHGRVRGSLHALLHRRLSHPLLENKCDPGLENDINNWEGPEALIMSEELQPPSCFHCQSIKKSVSKDRPEKRVNIVVEGSKHSILWLANWSSSFLLQQALQPSRSA